MNRLEKFLYSCLTTISLIAIGVFAVYWFRPENIPDNFIGWKHIADILLFLTVSYIIWFPVAMKVLVWAIASHIRQIRQFVPESNLKVAFITNFVPGSESIDLLHKTLPAMVAVDYPHDTWLLDEGNSTEVHAICDQYGVRHFSRAPFAQYNMPEGKFAARTKGGNHNAWYDQIGNSYDIVAQIDTDFIPHKNFLTKTLGYFRDPKVAFVGTPQIYGNIKDSIIARGAAEQTYSFYGPLLRGMDGMNTTMLIGANHVMRVEALKSVDHYSAHITEDLLTGMKLHAMGWKSIYVPEALAIGEGPSTWRAYFNQQKRWAYGCMHILFNHSFKLYKNMGLQRAIYYFLLQQHYFTGLAMGLSAICLSLYFMFGIQAATISLLSFIVGYLPVVAVSALMDLWLQRFNIRPKQERGLLLSAMYIGIAAWPIYLFAFLSLLKRKKLTYKVTPKGHKVNRKRTPYGLFLPHIGLGLITAMDVLVGVPEHHNAPLMLFWAILATCSMLLVPFIPALLETVESIDKWIRIGVLSINYRYRIFEFGTEDKGMLPKPPTDIEKYMYTERHSIFLILCSLISFSGMTISMCMFIYCHLQFWELSVLLALNVMYFVISFVINVGTHSFNLEEHKKFIAEWQPLEYPTVDVFLPTAGESLDVLTNTWKGVTRMMKHYPGNVLVYCLDDADRAEVKELARKFHFRYEVRPDRGYFKKAGNLRHGFRISDSEFIVIFDADFVPRYDFLQETLPYFIDPKLGILQTPQYFDVNQAQNWLERGAGAVQELFYRFSQVSRESNDASICVGSNAVYRREALNTTGGTALIEHSEDVHTGFNLRMKGWTLRYIPIIVAKGLCPATMPAFFKQQYRWCMGSMSLLSSGKFWQTKLKLRTRLSYMSGFLYYITTAIMSFYAPVVPLILLIALPKQIVLINYLFIIPAIIFSQIVYPLWHEAVYGIEAWATRSVYGWAHLFAIRDHLLNNRMSWQPTGIKKSQKDQRYISFRIMQIIFNFIPGLLWVILALYYFISRNPAAYSLILFSGLYYLFTAAKITFYTTKPIRFLPKRKRYEAASEVEVAV